MREHIRGVHEFVLRPDDYTTATKLIGWSWVGRTSGYLTPRGGQRLFQVRVGDEPGALGVKHAEVMERLYVIDAIMAREEGVSL